MSYFDAARVRARELCGMLGITRPVLSAPMRGIVGPELVAAVSEAGGLGVVPGADLSPEELLRFCKEVRVRTTKPFAVNLRTENPIVFSAKQLAPVGESLEYVYDELGLPHWEAHVTERPADKFFPDYHEQFEAALEARPSAMISSFGGFREPEAERLQAAGIVHIGTATTLREAKVLRAAEADAIIVQGSEAAGPRLNFEDADVVMMGLSSLLPAAVRATGLPVIAAGGVCGAEQAAGLAVAGASGFVLGTALIPTKESLAGERYRWFAAHGSPDQTRTTRLFTGRLERVYGGPLLDALAEYDVQGRTAPWPAPAALFEPLFRAAQEQGRDELLIHRLGQSCGRSAFGSAQEAVSTVSAWFDAEGDQF